MSKIKKKTVDGQLLNAVYDKDDNVIAYFVNAVKAQKYCDDQEEDYSIMRNYYGDMNV